MEDDKFMLGIELRQALEGNQEAIQRTLKEKRGELAELEAKMTAIKQHISTLEGRYMQNEDISKFLEQRKAESEEAERAEETRRKAQGDEVQVQKVSE